MHRTGDILRVYVLLYRFPDNFEFLKGLFNFFDLLMDKHKV